MRVALVLCVLVATPGLSSAGEAPPRAVAAAARDTVITIEQDQSTIKAEMAALGEVEVPGEKQWQRRKSAKVAVLSNMVLPGLGQVYNGRRLKAATMIGLMTYYAGRAWISKKNEVRHTIARDKLDPNSVEYRLEDLWVDYYRETKKDHMWWAGATYLIGMLDAFVDAHLYDVRAVDPTVIRGINNEHYIGLTARF